ELGERRREAEAAYNLGFAYQLDGDLAGAEDLHRRAADLYRELDDEINLAFANIALAMAAFQRGEGAQWRAPVEEARRTFLRTGHLWGAVQAAGLVASLAIGEGDYERARPAAIESLDADESLGHKVGI